MKFDGDRSIEKTHCGVRMGAQGLQTKMNGAE